MNKAVSSMLTLKALNIKHVKDMSKQKVHSAFIDFAKAYYSVWQKNFSLKCKTKAFMAISLKDYKTYLKILNVLSKLVLSTQASSNA